MSCTTTVIRCSADLEALAAFSGLRARRRRRLSLDEAVEPDRETRRTIEARLNRHYFACGCNEAAFGMAVGLCAYVSWMAIRGGGYGAVGWRDIWIGLAAASAASLVGNLLGRLRGALAFRRMARGLAQEWKARSHNEAPPCFDSKPRDAAPVGMV